MSERDKLVCDSNERLLLLKKKDIFKFRYLRKKCKKCIAVQVSINRKCSPGQLQNNQKQQAVQL